MAGEPLPKYRYNQLSKARRTIRLLQILSGPGEPALCSLQEVDLSGKLPDSPPYRYHCLSYTWGDPLDQCLSSPANYRNMSSERDRYIHNIDGSAISVTENLIDALQQLSRNQHSSLQAGCRSVEELRPYWWIDAICINQEDIEERNNQVRMINKIYQGAQSVLIWLGKEDEHTEGALKVLNSLARVSSTLVKSQDGFRTFNTDSNQILTALKELRDDLGIHDVKLYDFLHYAAFLQRKWFSRIWVLQESFFSAATVVFCGYHEISWQAIQKSSRVLVQTRMDVLLKANASYAIQDSVDVDIVKLPSNRLSNQMIFGKLQRDSAEVLSLGQLLYYSRYFDATDPRDKVFAILGMWDFPRHSHEKTGRISISPDYKKKTATVYVEATTAAIQESRSLDTLSFVDGSTAKEYGLPSWVPNYSQGPEMYPLIQPSALILIPMANFEVPSRSKALDLPVQGFEVDEVEQTGPTYGKIMNEFMLQPLLQLLLTYSQRPYPSGESRCEAFCRTVIKDTFRERPAGVEALTAFPAFIMQRVREIMDQIANLEAYEPHQAEALEEVLQLTERTIFELSSRYSEEKVIPTLQRMEEMIETEEEEGSPAEQELEADRKDIEEAFRIAYFGRRLFRTVKGFFGITTQSVMNGDKVWILAGARLPFVLRTRTVNDERWEFIGETYVRGIMDGEATVDETPLKRICLV